MNDELRPTSPQFDEPAGQPQAPGMYAPTGSIDDERISEIQDTVNALNDTPWPQMTEMWYVHGFNELMMAVGDLLDIVHKHEGRGGTRPGLG